MTRIIRSMTAVALAGLLAGACGPGGAVVTASPTIQESPATPSATDGATATKRPVVTTMPRSTEVPGPPSLALAGPATGAVRGELGTFTWDGLGSDAPWIVPPVAADVASGGLLEVVVAPPTASDHWAARWAPVAGGTPGDPTAMAEGGSGPVRLYAPSGPGAWGLALEVSFGAGRRGTWYWRLEVGP